MGLQTEIKYEIQCRRTGSKSGWEIAPGAPPKTQDAVINVLNALRAKWVHYDFRAYKITITRELLD